MIAITNISGTDSLTGVQKYQLRINAQVICEFEHDRTPEGLATCLRDAADAVEKHRAIVSDLTLANILDRLGEL
ncbi:MAG: hypothetical protein GQ570_03605 [Helicobacteraceae bacterium]|nr:hypothetical protein [Helicobacteraceae bacterium]